MEKKKETKTNEKTKRAKSESKSGKNGSVKAKRTSGYMIFSREFREKNPDSKFTLSQLSEFWKKCSESDKIKYNDLAQKEKDKAAHEEDKKQKKPEKKEEKKEEKKDDKKTKKADKSDKDDRDDKKDKKKKVASKPKKEEENEEDDD